MPRTRGEVVEPAKRKKLVEDIAASNAKPRLAFLQHRYLNQTTDKDWNENRQSIRSQSDITEKGARRLGITPNEHAAAAHAAALLKTPSTREETIKTLEARWPDLKKLKAELERQKTSG